MFRLRCGCERQAWGCVIKVPLIRTCCVGKNLNVLGWFPGHWLALNGVGDFVRQLNQPRLVFAAQLGQGRCALTVSDTPFSEMTEVYGAFNQMAEDVEQAGRER